MGGRRVGAAIFPSQGCVIADCYSRLCVCWSRSRNREPVSSGATQDCAGPIFSPAGPNAELYGAKDGYPLPDIAEARRQGDPWEPKYRVGAFTHIDHIYPTRLVRRAATPWKFKCSRADVYYNFQGSKFSLFDYMSRNPTTGLLIAKDDQIIFEGYQYARTDRDRFVSQSMVKTITGLLIGIAISEGRLSPSMISPKVM